MLDSCGGGICLDSGPPKRSIRPPLSQHYAPSVFEKYTASVTVGNKEVTLNLYDTAGECTGAQRSPWSSPRVSPCLVGGIPFLTP